MLCCSGEIPYERIKALLFYTLTEVSAKRLSTILVRGGTAKDIQARRLMKKQKEKAIIDCTKIGKQNTVVIKMN